MCVCVCNTTLVGDVIVLHVYVHSCTWKLVTKRGEQWCNEGIERRGNLVVYTHTYYTVRYICMYCVQHTYMKLHIHDIQLYICTYNTCVHIELFMKLNFPLRLFFSQVFSWVFSLFLWRGFGFTAKFYNKRCARAPLPRHVYSLAPHPPTHIML